MVAGMLSHQLKQHVIDGEKTIIQNPTDQQKYGHLCELSLNLISKWFLSSWFCRKDHEKAEFEVHEVYAVDVLISTGEGKVRGIIELILLLVLKLAHGCVFLFTHFFYSGKGRGSEDHCLQKRPQQGVWLKDEVIPDVVQRHWEALRYDAFHSEVTFFF